MDILIAVQAATAALCAVSGVTLAGASDSTLSRLTETAILEVSKVNTRETDPRLIIATDVITRFGRSMVKPPDFVLQGRGWRNFATCARAPLALSDLNFATTPEFDGASDLELAVLFRRGYHELEPGPDLFLFDAVGEAKKVCVAPIYRVNDEELLEAPCVEIDLTLHAGKVDVRGRAAWGVGIDLDEWNTHDLLPPDAMLVGVVIRHAYDDGAPFEPLKIMMVGGVIAGALGAASEDWIETAFLDLRPHGLFHGRTGGVPIGGGGGSGGGTPPVPPDRQPTPSPGGASLLGIAMAALARRSRSA